MPVSSAGVSRTFSGITTAPRQYHTVIAFQQLMVVEAEIGHAIARLDAMRAQTGRQSLRARAEFRVQ